MAGHRTSGLDLLRFGYGVMQDRQAQEEKDQIKKAYGWAAAFDPNAYLDDPEKGVKEIVSNLPGNVAYEQVDRFNKFVAAKQEELRKEKMLRERNAILSNPQYGPLKGQYFTQQNPNPAASPSAIQDRLARGGFIDAGKAYADLTGKIKANTQPVDPFKGFDKGYAQFLRSYGYNQSNPDTYRQYQNILKEQKAAGRSNVTVQNELGDAFKLGNPGEGNYWGHDENGNPQLITPKNSPDARAARAAIEKEQGRHKQTVRAGTTVIQDVQRALDIAETNDFATGPAAILFQNVPGTDAYSAKGFVDSALSNVGLDTLQQMRENSPTGGALGQVPVQQQKRLEQVLGSLLLGQKKDVVIDNMRRVKNIYMDIVYGTPEEISQLEKLGKISPEDAKRYSQRSQLSFDELGNPVKKSTSGDGGKYKEGQTATNPKTGERLIFTGGRWEKLQ